MTGVAGPEQRDRAVHASAHRDGHALLAGRRSDSGAQRVVQGIAREPLALDRSSFEERSTLDITEELADTRPLAGSGLDPLPGHDEPHPGEISVPGGVPYELTVGGHEKRRCPTPPMKLRA